MAEVKKVTKKENYAVLREIVAAADVENKDELLAFIDNQMQLLDNKAAKAKENADKKKADGDALREVVYKVLSDELQTIDAITARIEGEDVTKGKVTARLTQLINTGLIVKDIVKTEDGRKVTAYKLAVTVTE